MSLLKLQRVSNSKRCRTLFTVPAPSKTVKSLGIRPTHVHTRRRSQSSFYHSPFCRASLIFHPGARLPPSPASLYPTFITPDAHPHSTPTRHRRRPSTHTHRQRRPQGTPSTASHLPLSPSPAPALVSRRRHPLFIPSRHGTRRPPAPDADKAPSPAWQPRLRGNLDSPSAPFTLRLVLFGYIIQLAGYALGNFTM